LLTLGANRSAKSEFFGLKIFSATNEAIPLFWVVMTGLVVGVGETGSGGSRAYHRKPSARWASLNMTVAEMPGLFGLKPTQKEEAWIGCI
jgi:hypothetical protein